MMANVLNVQAMNSPVWNAATTVSVEVMTGASDKITVSGYYIVISNVGANNIYVGPDDSGSGILLQPGGSFETAIKPGSNLYIFGTAAQPVTVVHYA
tara:strand:+ start:144 stop:434 length:291 start_codon:yes stop_codon:yes gene_type:complete